MKKYILYIMLVKDHIILLSRSKCYKCFGIDGVYNRLQSRIIYIPKRKHQQQQHQVHQSSQDDCGASLLLHNQLDPPCFCGGTNGDGVSRQPYWCLWKLYFSKMSIDKWLIFWFEKLFPSGLFIVAISKNISWREWGENVVKGISISVRVLGGTLINSILMIFLCISFSERKLSLISSGSIYY